MVPAVAVEMVVGFHVPVMLLVEVVGKAPGEAPTQYGPRLVKRGATLLLTLTVVLAVAVHPAALVAVTV